MKYIIGTDICDSNNDASAAIISVIKDGEIVKVIDSKINRDPQLIKKFVEEYESDFFTSEYQFNMKMRRYEALKNAIDRNDIKINF